MPAAFGRPALKGWPEIDGVLKMHTPMTASTRSSLGAHDNIVAAAAPQHDRDHVTADDHAREAAKCLSADQPATATAALAGSPIPRRSRAGMGSAASRAPSGTSSRPLRGGVIDCGGRYKASLSTSRPKYRLRHCEVIDYRPERRGRRPSSSRPNARSTPRVIARWNVPARLRARARAAPAPRARVAIPPRLPGLHERLPDRLQEQLDEVLRDRFGSAHDLLMTSSTRARLTPSARQLLPAR